VVGDAEPGAVCVFYFSMIVERGHGKQQLVVSGSARRIGFSQEVLGTSITKVKNAFDRWNSGLFENLKSALFFFPFLLA